MAGTCYIIILLLIHVVLDRTAGVISLGVRTLIVLLTGGMILAGIMNRKSSPYRAACAALFFIVLVALYVINGTHFFDFLALMMNAEYPDSPPGMERMKVFVGSAFLLRKLISSFVLPLTVLMAAEDMLFFVVKSLGKKEKSTPEGGMETGGTGGNAALAAMVVGFMALVTALGFEKTTWWKVEALSSGEEHLQWIRLTGEVSRILPEIRKCAFEVNNDSFLVDYRGPIDGEVLIRCRDGRMMMLRHQNLKTVQVSGKNAFF